MMNLIQYLAALGVVVLSAEAGRVDVGQCNGRSALWINPSLCTETAKCSSDSQILSALNYEVYDVAYSGHHGMAGKEYDVRDDEQVGTMLTNFMTWASLTRDIEMQKEGQELCAASDNTMPWDPCTHPECDLKLIHRTQPLYNFDPQYNWQPAMSGKEQARKTKSGRFGLPREKVREFMSVLKPKTMHWRKVPAVQLYA